MFGFGRNKANPFRTSNVNPSPSDDRAPGDGYFNAGWQNGATDDDRYHPHSANRLIGSGAGENGYYPSLAPLFGQHFRVGYFRYFGIDINNRMQSGEGDTTIGKPTVMRPPIIPRRNATPAGVRNAIAFVQSMPYETWRPIIPPLVSRR